LTPVNQIIHRSILRSNNPGKATVAKYYLINKKEDLLEVAFLSVPLHYKWFGFTISFQ